MTLTKWCLMCDRIFLKFPGPRNDRHLDSHIDDHPGISQMPKSKSSHILGFPNDRWCVMTRRCD